MKMTLHKAAMDGNVEEVKKVIQNKKNKRAKNSVNALDKGSGWTALHFAAHNGHKEVIEYLLKEVGANVNAKDFSGNNTPLHEAIINGSLGVVPCLVKSGASVNEKDKYGDTPLHIASTYGNLKLVQFLVEKGHDVNIEVMDDSGNTALHDAIEGQHWPVVEYLVQTAGANVEARNHAGKSPLDYASDAGNPYLIRSFEKERAQDGSKKTLFTEVEA